MSAKLVAQASKPAVSPTSKSAWLGPVRSGAGLETCDTAGLGARATGQLEIPGLRAGKGAAEEDKVGAGPSHSVAA